MEDTVLDANLQPAATACRPPKKLRMITVLLLSVDMLYED